MTPETIDAIKGAMLPIAEKIGQTAEWGWIVVLKQQYVIAAQMGIAVVFFLALSSALAYWAGKWSFMIPPESKDWVEADRRKNRIAVIVLSSFGSFMSLAIAMAILGGATGRLINPDYYALQFFIQLVSPSSR